MKEVKKIEFEKYDPEEILNDLEEEQEEQEEQKSGCLKNIIIFIVIISFLAVSIPNIAYLIKGKHDFIEENQALLDDAIVQESGRAVVSIEAYPSEDAVTGNTMQGTGFNILSTGKIVTNLHVIDGASKIVVRFPNSKTFNSISHKAVEGVDVAIIDIDGEDLPFIEINQSEPVQEGDTVTVVGNPLGYRKIAQRGLVKRTYRTSETETPVFVVDIKLNPGNSGSPVLNEKGEVVGIIFAILKTEDEHENSNGIALPIEVLENYY